MLHTRSILLQALILLIANHASGQHYESEYGLSEAEAEDPTPHHTPHHADVESGQDYTKYFNADSPAPDISQIQAEVHPEGHAGFVPPLEFTYDGPSHYEYGASNKKEILKPKNPFHEEENKKEGFVSKDDFSADLPQFVDGSSYGPPDYFEESRIKQQQKEKEKEHEHDYDNPYHYNPHKTATEVDDLAEKLPRQKAQKKYNKYNPKLRYGKEQSKKVPYHVPDYYHYHPKSKQANYNTGKSSSSVSQTPHAPGYYSQNPAPVSPYQKYSFQPVKDNEGLKSSHYEQSTIAPYNPSYIKVKPDSYYDYEPSASDLQESLKKGHCKKVNKEINAKDLTSGRYKRQAMNCYVCEDPKSGTEFEKCSFSAPLYPKKVALQTDPSDLYNPVTDPYFRFKRYSKDDAGGYSDPYEYVKAQSSHYYTKPEDYISNVDAYKPQYNPEYEKSSSEIQAEKLKKSPADCKKVEKDGMTCTICSSKTGGNYEQCSYSSKPSEQKYAYVRERKYDGNTPVSDKEVGSTEPKEIHHEGESTNAKVADDYHEKKHHNHHNDHHEKKHHNHHHDHHHHHPSSYEEEMEKGKRSKHVKEDDSSESKDTSSYEIPDYYRKKNVEHNDKDSESYGTTDKEKIKDKPSEDYHNDEYHFKFFPEFSNEETKNDETYVKPGHHESKQDVEEVLAEFAKKDRSECKKARKNGMTCYLCVDKNGIQHEECMYVSESKPEVSKVSYLEEKDVKSPMRSKSSPDIVGASSNVNLKEQMKRKVRMVDYEVAASEEHASRVKYDPEKAAKTKFKLYNEKKQKIKTVKDHSTAESRDEDAEHDKEYKELEEEKEDKDKKPEASEKSSADDAEEPQPKTPEEFVVGDEEGAFSAETKPVFSKTLGVTLPKYMLTKSEFEQIFDEFVAAG